MKKRTAFVANSSSSSFLITYAPGAAKATLTIEVDLERYAKRKAATAEEVEKICSYNEYGEETKQHLLDQIAAGKVVADCTVYTDGDDALQIYLADRSYGGDVTQLRKMFPSGEIEFVQPKYNY